jgi:hypothetical protein
MCFSLIIDKIKKRKLPKEYKFVLITDDSSVITIWNPHTDTKLILDTSDIPLLVSGLERDNNGRN